MLENGKERCSCVKKSCERHGNCEACLAFHRQNPKRPLPYCKCRKKKAAAAEKDSTRI